jgi:hypothetical protein
MALKFNKRARTCILQNLSVYLSGAILDVYPDTVPYPTDFSLAASGYIGYIVRYTGLAYSIVDNKIVWNSADASKTPLFNGTASWARLYQQNPATPANQIAIFTDSLSDSDPSCVLQLSSLVMTTSDNVSLLNFSFALN